MPNDHKPLPDLTAAQAARALGLSVATVKRRSDDGTIPFRQLGPRGRRRYRASELIRLGCTRAEIERALGLSAAHPATP